VRQIAVTFDYRCPFAYNAHKALVALVRSNADFDVRFTAFSLDQVHAAEDEQPMWERPADERGSGVLALCYGIAVRDRFPDQFLDAHVALFAARHEQAQQLKDEAVLQEAVASVGLEAGAVAAEVASGRPLETLAAEHTEAVQRWSVFGVPTFIEGDDAVFVRFMERGRVDDLESMLDLLAWTRLNEFKRTKIPR
jgi:predicted DsbA family dithiol-disulfide isomerase